MKCKVCGFDEKLPLESVCKQCGAALGGSSLTDEHKKTALNIGQEPLQVTKYTVLGKQSGAREEYQDLDMPHCMKCDYPMRNGVAVCPNCGYEHDSSSRHAVEAGPERSTRVAPKTKRIEDFSSEHAGPKISLVPMNSKKASILSTYDEELILSRDKVDGADDTISSLNHLRIYRDQATSEWRLENTATNKAVFIQVNGAVSIEPGAVIQVGQNKLFQFRVEE